MTRAECRELRSDVRSEIEEIDADLIGYFEDLRRAKEQIAEAPVPGKSCCGRSLLS